MASGLSPIPKRLIRNSGKICIGDVMEKKEVQKIVKEKLKMIGFTVKGSMP